MPSAELRSGAGVVVCARCGAHGDHLYGYVWEFGDGKLQRVFWFCARCIDPDSIAH